MDARQKYLFDLHGYVVLRGVLSTDQVAALNAACAEIEAGVPDRLPGGVALGKPVENGELYISNIAEGGPAFEDLIDLEPVVDIVRGTSPWQFRLNHTNLTTRHGEGHTYMHMGGTPVHPKGMYVCQNGQIGSTLTKAVFPLAGTRIEDGCFAVIPGSHKSNFERPFGDHPDDNPPLVPIACEPGDAVVFTEALAHGSLVNKSGALRRTLFYCYSVGFMPDWGKLDLRFSDEFVARLSEPRREIVRMK